MIGSARTRISKRRYAAVSKDSPDAAGPGLKPRTGAVLAILPDRLLDRQRMGRLGTKALLAPMGIFNLRTREFRGWEKRTSAAKAGFGCVAYGTAEERV